MLKYPVTLTPDSNGTLLVGFPDFPEANSVGESKEDALRNAVDALSTVLSIYFDDHRAIPLPSVTVAGDAFVTLPHSEAKKILDWNQKINFG
jgi:antitoxin HicB